MIAELLGNLKFPSAARVKEGLTIKRSFQSQLRNGRSIRSPEPSRVRRVYVFRGSTAGNRLPSTPQRCCCHRTTQPFPRVGDRMRCCDLWTDRKETAIF